ncbi:MAG TPA: ABC transporter permease [Streptosporangiaceae bacterium]|nr:ABC transporter permease [Streptosporangiaceae bacterium]
MSDLVIGYITRRIGQAVIVLVGVTIIVFILRHLLPGSIARAIIGPRASQLQIAAFNRQYGLNRALPLQYLSFLDQLMHGNLGYSFRLNSSVDSIVLHDLPNDVLLVGVSLVLALVIAIPVGILQAVRRNKLTDHAATGISFLLYSMPSYLLGLLLIAVFAVHLRLLPAEAPQASTITGVISDPAGLVLPIATLTLVTCALFSRYMRSSAIDSLAQDYIRTARAKGLGQGAILSRHLLRNSLIPVVTLVGISLPGILTFGLIIEELFNFPGIGLEYFNAAVNGDYPVVFGITVLVALATVTGNLLADIAYAVLDPRVRYD